MENLVRNIQMKDIPQMRLTPDQFIELYNKDEAVLVDIRFPFETDVWSMNFGINIPLNELPERLAELPKDKLVVCACPENFRSLLALMYLKTKGYNAKMLFGGLLELTSRLRGGAAKDININKIISKEQ
jgi:rhodanese-related sulfurtransferase